MDTKSNSFWLIEKSKVKTEKLNKDISTDVAIIGGGLTGLTTALFLSEHGIKVEVFEANEIGNGASGYTSAKITSQHGTIYSDLIKHSGKEIAKKYADINEDAINKIKSLIEKYSIDCNFQTATSNIFTSDNKNIDRLFKEYEAARSLGLDVTYTSNLSLPFKAYANISQKNQAMFHPIKYLNSLADVLTKNGVKIYENTRIIKVVGDGGYVLITDKGYNIKTDKVIIATKYPIINKKGMLFSKIHAERSYVVAASMPNINLDGYYINIDKNIRSIRPYIMGDSDLVLIGGANHATGECENTEKPYQDLIAYAVNIDVDAEIKYTWSTQDCMTLDKIPYIGLLSNDMPNVYLATGFNKWGMTQSMVAGIIISNNILNKENPWKDIFDPKRKLNLNSFKEMVIQGADVMGDYIKTILPVKQKSLENIEIGEGKIVEIDGKAYGVYRDLNGKDFIVDAKCSHLGCRLSFNTAEKTWDCPCHGSRYSIDGKVIEAPAVLPLDTKDKG